jgi:hypothetical protein
MSQAFFTAKAQSPQSKTARIPLRRLCVLGGSAVKMARQQALSV